MRNDDRYGLLDDPDIPKLDELPEGWSYIDGCTTAPCGWMWAHNRKSIRSGERKKALVRVFAS